LSPGDPVRMKLGTEATPEEIAGERERMGLTRPLPVQYFIWLSDLTRLELGRSQVNNRPVTTLLAEHFPNTLRLSLTAFLLAVLIGLPLGCLAAVRRDSGTDVAITSLNSLGLAVPAFWLGMVLILVFSVTLQWLPSSGVGDPNRSWFANLQYLVLPVATIAVSNLSVFARFVRSAMLDVLGADYVRTARAKGVFERAVIGRHALRNALIPVVTLIGLNLADLIGSAILTETVFNWPGLGSAVAEAIGRRDAPVVLGGTLVLVLLYLLINLAVDVSYGLFDPRIRYGESR
jgi:peptide/nickel transport system permease protein